MTQDSVELQVSLEQLVSQVLEVLPDSEVCQVFQANAVIPDVKDQLDNLERRDHKVHQDSRVVRVRMDNKELLDRRELLEILVNLEMTDSQVK